MKIAVIQARVKSDCPAGNLETIEHALHHGEHAGVAATLLPPLALSGRLGPEALGRPGLKAKYDKVWQDFLALSRKFPGQTVGLTWLDVERGEMQARYAQNGAPAARPQGLSVTWQTHVFDGRPWRPPQMKAAPGWRVCVSAVGGDGPFIYEGATGVFDRHGALKGWLGGFEPGAVIFDTESQALPTVEPAEPDEIATLYAALKTGLGDYVRDCGEGRAVLGLSGGLDSALVATLAADALGPQNVLAVAMPSQFSSPDSLALAKKLAENLKIKFAEVPIEAIKTAFLTALAPLPKDDEKPGHLADENVQARIRGVLLMYLANRDGRILLATGNKSEGAMGYCTLYGDTCGGIAPIGDVYKTTAYKLAEYANRAGEVIPKGIIERPPSAELRPGQKDEDTLPPYKMLDDILARHLEGEETGAAIAKETGYPALTVAWALAALKKAAFKRAQEPFALRATTHPLAGLDW